MSESSYAALARRRWVFCRWQKIDRSDNAPYLCRLILLRTPWFAVYLHFFLGDDDACPHCHPWAFWSFILWGGYFETSVPQWAWDEAAMSDIDPLVHQCTYWYGPGSILRRPAHWIHRIERGRRMPVTLVITGRRCRKWGFYTPVGFVPWQQYSSKEHCN